MNYWLYGCWVARAGASYTWAELKILGHGPFTSEGADGKLAWFKAGYYGNFALANSCAIPNVLPAGTRPTNEDPGRLEWQIGGDLDVVPHIVGIDMWDEFFNKTGKP